MATHGILAGAPAARSLIGQIKDSRDLTMPLISVIDADVRLSAETMGFGTWRTGRSATSISLHDGQLLVNLAEMVLPGGGAAEGEIAIEGSPTTPNYTAHWHIDDVEIKDLTTGLVGTPLVRGKGSVTLDLKSSGSSGMDLLSRLDGRIDIAMPKGGMATCTIRELAAFATAAQQQGCRMVTSLAPFKASAWAASGVMTADRVEAYSGGDLMKIEGNVDLVTSFMHVDISSTTLGATELGVDAQRVDHARARDFVTIDGRPDDARIGGKLR